MITPKYGLRSAIIFLSMASATDLGATPEPENPIEKIFTDAEKYTVKIRTSKIHEFVEDSSESSWSGTGFLVNREKGWILTNAHVSGKAPSKLYISFKNGKREPAKKVYVDPYLDVAILIASPAQIPVDAQEASLDCKTTASVGHAIGAYGHPKGSQYTGSQGIVSGIKINRAIEMIQIDAPINSGNSGGPLISFNNGRVIGINTSKIEDSDGLGFATPMKYTCTILSLLEKNIDPTPPLLPVMFAEDPDSNGKLYVAATITDEATGKFRVNDHLVGIEGEIDEAMNLTQMIDRLRGRDGAITVTVKRNEQYVDLETTLLKPEGIMDREGVFFSGILIGNSPYNDTLSLSDKDNLFVHSVRGGTYGKIAQVDDISFLSSVDGQPFMSLDKLHRYLQSVKKNSDVILITKSKYGGGRNDYFAYRRSSLPVENLQYVESQW